jgi:hypothetical protein
MRRVPFLGAAGILSLVFCAVPLWAAGSRCQSTEGTIRLTFDMTREQWVGGAQMFIGMKPFSGHVEFQTESSEETNGASVGTERATFDFGGGDILKERDRFLFGPSEDDPAVFHYTALGRVTKGTGRFEGAYGSLVIQGFATLSDTAPPVFSGTLKGRVCGLE